MPNWILRPALFSGVNAVEHLRFVIVDGERSAEPERRLGISFASSFKIFPPETRVASGVEKSNLAKRSV